MKTKDTPIIRILLISIMMTGFMSFTSSDNKWNLEKKKNNVSVYTRNIEGSQLKEFQASTTINSSIENLHSLLKDFDSYNLWIDNYKSAKELKKVSDSEYYFYLVIATPWPVSNRDVIIHYNIVRDEASKSILFNMEGIPDYIGKKDGLVRMPKFKGFWKVTEKENGQVEVICQVHAEPGGSVPDWLANSMMTDGPFNTMTRIGEWANKPKYNTNNK